MKSEKNMSKKNYDDYRTNNVNVFIWLRKNKNKSIPEDIYKVDEKNFSYRVLCQCNGEVHVKRHMSGRPIVFTGLYGKHVEELSWDWGTLMLPEQAQNGEVSCSEYKCLFFRPIMREFLGKQQQAILDKDPKILNEYVSKVQSWVGDNLIYVFETKDGKVNLKPHDQNILEHLNGKYVPTRISEAPFARDNFINIIGKDMVGENIKRIDPDAEKEYTVVEFVESKFSKAVRGIRNFLRLDKNHDIEAVNTRPFESKDESKNIDSNINENEGK